MTNTTNNPNSRNATVPALGRLWWSVARPPGEPGPRRDDGRYPYLERGCAARLPARMGVPFKGLHA